MAGDTAVIKKIAKLLNEIRENPIKETGRIKLMKYGFGGKYSCRINHKHRLVYTIETKIATIYL